MADATTSLPPLPPDVDLETREILLALNNANRYLAELKGAANSVPNAAILINTLTLQEAMDSSEIESIVTTHDELYRACSGDTRVSPAAKEVESYARALRDGFAMISQRPVLSINLIKQIQSQIEPNKAGLRKVPGTTLTDMATGEVIYEPPQNPDEIVKLLSDLERFMNDDTISHLDPLIKLALIHYQFESIHPFYDGNGRCGRIVNVLYLVLKGLLDIPILYLSRYIISHKADYYRLLQEVRTKNGWLEWVLFMLRAVASTSRQTLVLLQQMRDLLLDTKQRLRRDLPSMYSQDLLNSLFMHPYTKVAFIQEDLKVTRATATKRLEKLVAAGFLEKQKHGRSNYYLNLPLIALLMHSAE